MFQIYFFLLEGFCSSLSNNIVTLFMEEVIDEIHKKDVNELEKKFKGNIIRNGYDIGKNEVYMGLL